jgi:hypothetical protein
MATLATTRWHRRSGDTKITCAPRNGVGGGVSRLDALKIAGRVGDFPQDVSFAIRCEIVRTLLEAKGLVVYPLIRSRSRRLQAGALTIAGPEATVVPVAVDVTMKIRQFTTDFHGSMNA